MEDATI